MMNKLDIAYNYVQACQVQETHERLINVTLGYLCPDNQVFSLCEPVLKYYQELVLELLGEEAFDWIQYWQYESDYGRQPRDFSIDGVEYNTNDMTLYKFLEVTCGLTK